MGNFNVTSDSFKIAQREDPTLNAFSDKAKQTPRSTSLKNQYFMKGACCILASLLHLSNSPRQLLITLFTTKPIRVKPYPIPFAKVSDVVKEVDKILKLGVIEPSKSPHCSPLLLVKKTDGTNRAVVDFRQLNRATTFNSEPMPNPEAIFATLSKYHVFSKLDCSKGCWQFVCHVDIRCGFHIFTS